MISAMSNQIRSIISTADKMEFHTIKIIFVKTRTAFLSRFKKTKSRKIHEDLILRESSQDGLGSFYIASILLLHRSTKQAQYNPTMALSLSSTGSYY